MKQGIVLFAHGSRDRQWMRPFEAIAAAVGRKAPAAAIALGCLEHGPSLDEAVSALAAKGAMTIRVVPLFLGSGGHVKEDLPKLVAKVAAEHPQQKLSLENAIGEQPAVIEAIAEAIAASR